MAMRFEFKLPDIGEGVIEGEVVKWLVQDGEVIKPEQPVVEVMTDKATVVIPSPKGGKVLERHGKEGEMIKVHSTLLVVETEGAAAQPAAAPAPAQGAPAPSPAQAAPANPPPPAAAPRPAPIAAVASKPAQSPEPARPRPQLSAVPPAPAQENGAKVRATPVTRKLAAERGLDLSQVSGTGPGGRVLKTDVLALINGGETAGAQGAGMARGEVVALAEDEHIPLRGLRRRIAEKMQKSKRTAAHFTFVEEVDATRLVDMRKRVNEIEVKQGGGKISYLPFIVKATVAALRRYPTLNASVDDEKNELVVKHRYNIGIAAATPDGLIVPVVHGADRLTLRQISEEITRMAADAKAGKSRLDDLQGGTFTITSLGEIGGLFATPVINWPEVAILGIHRIRPRAVVRDGQIVVREMMYVSCSFDHRVIDGAVGAQFTYELIKYLEDPELLMLELS
jgi:pyruvate dehydrogenase E2 component (dihydrolipoamide acetyltransferase)